MFVVSLLLCLLQSSLGQTLRHSPSGRHRQLQSSRHRRLQAGSVHSGSQAHVLIDITDAGFNYLAEVYIEDIGNNKTGRFQIAEIVYEEMDGTESLTVDKKMQDRAGAEVDSIPFSVGENDNALAFEVTGCSGTINSTFLDIQCEFNFKDSDEFADATRNHVKCTHNCAEFKDYSIVVVTTVIDEVPQTTEAATILPFVGTCTVGTYHESDHLCVLNSCHRCSSGYYCSGASDHGHIPTYGNAGSLLNEQCDACEPGLFANEPQSSACKNCAVGTYEDRTNSTACQDCTVGTYEDGTASTECKDCTAGTYEDRTNSTECKDCTAGTYEDGTASTECKNCDAGTYEDGTASTECKNCTAGTYADVIGLSLCKNCDAGTYEDGTASTECKNCDAGNYADVTGLSLCKNCFTGTYQNDPGTTSCKVCQDGHMTTVNSGFNNMGATACTACAPGRETDPERLGPCAFVDCLDEPHKCRNPTTGTCGGIGAVNCQGQCVNKYRDGFSTQECPTMYSSFKLHTSDNYGVCEEVDADAQETCVEWRGPLQNGFTLDQVQSLPSQDDEFCNSTKAIYKDNMVKSVACNTQFSVIVPMYIYPNTWVPESDDYKAWHLLLENIGEYSHIQFHIIINPGNGADSSAPPNDNWKEYLDVLGSLPNVHLYGYVPTGYGAATINVTKYIQDYKTNWGISNIFLDEVNGAFKTTSPITGEYYTSTYDTYKDYTATGKTICNFGSPRDQTGVEYSHDWLQVCDYSVLYEDSVVNLATYGPTYVQQSMSPTSIAAIMHTYAAEGDTPFQEQLQALYANHFGMVYFAPTVPPGDNVYGLFYNQTLWETFLQEITNFTPISTVPQIPWVPQLLRTPVSPDIYPTDETLQIVTGPVGPPTGLMPAAFSHPAPSMSNSPFSNLNVVSATSVVSFGPDGPF